MRHMSKRKESSYCEAHIKTERELGQDEKSDTVA